MAERADEQEETPQVFILKPFTVREGAELLRRVLDQNRVQGAPDSP